MPQLEAPILAQYLALDTYSPKYGDYVVWAGWFSTWHGLVIDLDNDLDQVSIIFAGLPYLLFTLTVQEQDVDTKKIPLGKMRNSSKGTWAVMRHEKDAGTIVWYI